MSDLWAALRDVAAHHVEVVASCRGPFCVYADDTVRDRRVQLAATEAGLLRRLIFTAVRPEPPRPLP